MASGFRAFSRPTAQRLFVHSKFSYCMETLIQAGNLRLHVASVDIGVNRKTRDSRLFKSVPEYIWKSGTTMLTMFVHYRPSRFFGSLATVCFAGALLLGLRFVYFIYLAPSPDPHRTYIPSLILLATLAAFGAGLVLLAVVTELMRAQSRLMEEVLFELRRQSDPQK